MLNLDELSQKYDFDYGYVNDFVEELAINEELLSKVSAISTNPCQILSNCKTVVVLAFKHDNFSKNSNIAAFAWGEDYHNKLKKIGEKIIPLFNDAIFLTDTHILNERYFAKKSGIGHIGKNSMFISDKFGSFCHLAILLTSDKLSNNRKSIKHCGSCTKCIDACPTNAIGEQIDCRKCLSERLQSRNNLDFQNIGNNVYGCDICQNVCPYNIFDKSPTLLYNNVSIENLLFLKKKEFDLFKDRTFYWIGYRSFIRNIHVAYVNNTQDYSKLSFLENSNSQYLKDVAKVLKGDEFND